MPCPFLLEDGSRFDLSGGNFPANTLEVFISGFEFLGLKPGAEKLFKKLTEAEILRLIQTAKRSEDLDVLALVKPTDKSLQDAVASRREELDPDKKKEFPIGDAADQSSADQVTN